VLALTFLSFDLDHPLEVDDEYWETPEGTHGFKQPSDKPPKVAFFNCYLKLNQILAFALRTIVRLLYSLSNMFSHRLYIVFDQQIEDSAWLCGAAMGAAYRCRVGLCPQQVDRFRSGSL
jgi:hypothetical protein